MKSKHLLIALRALALLAALVALPVWNAAATSEALPPLAATDFTPVLWAALFLMLATLGLPTPIRRLLRHLQRQYAAENARTLGLSLVAAFLLLVPVAGTAQAPSCACKEFLYVNEPGGVVHKMEITPVGGALTEVGGVNGIPWINDGVQFPFPHGLGVDRNGFLYIGSNFGSPNKILRVDCLGNIKPTSEFVAPPSGNWGQLLTNIQSYNGFIYANGPSARIYKIDPCDGSTVGYVQFSDGSDDWGLYVDKNGKFFVTQPTGKIYAFTPTADDFDNNATFAPIIDLGVNPAYGGLSPQYSGTGLQGIVTDDSGNIYVVEGNRDAPGTPSRLLKFTSTGTFVAAGPIDNNGSNNAGWNQMVGIVYSTSSGKLYTTSLNPNEDCIYRWKTDLSPDGEAVGPVPNPFGQCKAIGILTECCPTSGTVDASACDADLTSRVSLSKLLSSTCDGVVCDGQWDLQPGSTNFTFNDCDLTATPTSLPACATFELHNTGVTGSPCAAYCWQT
jgi:hypothetical protein